MWLALHHILIDQKHMYVNNELMISAEFTNNASLISASHQEHMRFINVNESEKINKVITWRNEINTLSIDYEITIDNLIDHVYQ